MFSKKKYSLSDAIRKVRKKAEKRLLLSLYKKMDFTFDFYLNEDMTVNDFLKMLMSKHPQFWDIIKKSILSSPHVSIAYSDRYLNTPLGCILLSQLIRQICVYFNVYYDTIEINISRTGFHPNKKNPVSTMIFSNYPERDRFFKTCMKSLVKAEFIEKERNIPHQRVLTITNTKGTVEIVFDGGISYGWRLSRENEQLTIEQLEASLTENFVCFNQLSRKFDRKGIFYVVRVLYKD